MERAENALRTGQTENHFPAYYRATVLKIAEEKESNRQAWAALGPAGRRHVEALRMVETFAAVADAVSEVWRGITDTIGPLIRMVDDALQATQQDFALAPPVQETPAARERRMRAEQNRMRSAFQAAHKTTPARIRSNLK